MAFKMKSGNKPGFKGMGSSPVKAYNSPAYKTEDTSKLTNKEKQDNLRKVIPNEEAFNKLSTTERGNFTKSWANAGGVTKQVKKSPAKQRLNKGGEGQDQNKIFDKNGKHVGDYVNGKKVMKSTKSAHGQLNDAERDFKRDTERALKSSRKDLPIFKIKEGSKSPAKAKTETKKQSPRMTAAIKKAKDSNFIRTNRSLTKVGKKTITREEYDAATSSPAKQIKLDNKYPKSNFPKHSPRYDGPIKKDGFGPSTAFGGVKNPELVKTKKTKSKKVMKDGPKNKVHGVKDPGNWQPHQFKKKKSPAKQTKDTFDDGSKKSSRDKFNDTETATEQRKADRKDDQKYPYPRKFTNKGVKTIVGEKTSGFGPISVNSTLTRKQKAISRAEMKGLDSKSPYWFKINGEFKTHAEYKAYENKPGNMEGGGKQTNHPDAMGYKAKHKADRAKLKTK